MKGIILAGGHASRLLPCTQVTNKHLLPVYNKPMIFYPLETLKQAGIEDILIVTGPQHAGDFLKLLGSGKDFGVRLVYKLQDEAGGIAQALSLVRDFIKNEKFIVILGDNIIEDNIKEYAEKFENSDKEAMIFLKEVKEARRFGVAEIYADKIIGIKEKPKNPKSSYAVVGLYMYKSNVFDIIKTLKPSARGELEITDVNNAYIERKRLDFAVLKGYWADAGTFQSLHRASTLVKNKNKG